MPRKLGAYLAGSIRFEIQGGLGECFLNACAQNQIPVQNIRPIPLGFQAQVPVRDYRKLHRLARKYRCRLRMTEKRGACFALWMYHKRWGFLAGAAVAVAVLLLCSRIIWKVCFYNFLPQEELFLRKQLYEKHISEGSIVSTAELKTAQRELFIENVGYGWVKLNFVKGRLVVEKGRAAPRPAPAVQKITTNVVALCDGWIERVEASGGQIRHTAGQYVAQGDIVIDGIWRSKRGVLYTANAQGKVYAKVERIYVVRQPLQAMYSVPDAKQESFYAIWFAGLRLPLYREQAIQAAPQTTQTVVKYPLNLLGLPLPATVEETRVRGVREINCVLKKEQAENIARARAFEAMRAELPELTVLSHTETSEIEDDTLILRMHMQGRANIAHIVPADVNALPPE